MTKIITEAQKVGLLRNALLVAGYEMGEQGEHWPVINDTIHKVAADWEQSQIDANVKIEMKPHLYAQIEIMESSLKDCAPQAKAELGALIKELREACDAYFEPCDDAALSADDEVPMHIQRAEMIVQTLGGSHD